MTDHFRISVNGIFDVLSHGFSCHCHAVQVQKSKAGNFLHHRVDTACLIQILHVSRTGRSKMTDIRSFLADLIGKPHLKIETGFMGDCRDMKHGVCRASQSHIHGQRIDKSLFCHNIPGTDILLQHVHDSHAGMLGKFDSLGINGRNGAVSFQSHAQDLCQAVHTVRCVHAGAGAAGRAHMLLIVADVTLRHCPGRIGADSLEHGGKASLSSVDMSGQHRTAADKNRRDIHSRRSHQKPRNILVTVRDHDKGVKLVRDCQTFG